MSTRCQKKKRLLPLLLVLATAVSVAGLISCTPDKGGPPDAAGEYRTKTGKTIIVSETHPVGVSLSNIEIRTAGFEHNFHEVYKDRDPVSDVLMADLDGNGFDEIYIITRSAGSGSYGTVLGFASNRDKSMSMISFPGTQTGDENFEEYEGHDTFRIEGRKLVRTFPIYRKDDRNGNPTGGRRKVVYGLIPGEAMWELRIEQSEISP